MRKNAGQYNNNAKNAGVAQSVEQLIRNQQVGGSSPPTSSKLNKKTYYCYVFFYFQTLNFRAESIPKNQKLEKGCHFYII